MPLCNHVEEAMATWPLKPMDNIRPNFSRSPNGCLPAVAQDAESGEVLMLAYMNEESFNETLETGRAVYFSRSRNRLWRKGEESGHVQQVYSIRIDCDEDAILLLVSQEGAACHEGYRSCFFREVKTDSTQIIAERIVDPKTVYKS
jgi:phosphoribosyl-AMP cyclohydrolase